MSVEDTAKELMEIGRLATIIDRYQGEIVPKLNEQLQQLQAENERLKANKQLGLYPIVKEYRIGGLEEFTCEECGHINSIDNSYVEKDYWICPICGKNVGGIFRNYCDNCGQKIERRDAE